MQKGRGLGVYPPCNLHHLRREPLYVPPSTRAHYTLVIGIIGYPTKAGGPYPG